MPFFEILHVKANFKKHLISEDYQNLLKKFEIVKRVNLEIYDPDEKLEYLTGAKEFKDDEHEDNANKDSSVVIVEEKIVNMPETSAISSSSSSMASRLAIPGTSSLDLDITYEEPRTIIKRDRRSSNR